MGTKYRSSSLNFNQFN